MVKSFDSGLLRSKRLESFLQFVQLGHGFGLVVLVRLDPELIAFDLEFQILLVLLSRLDFFAKVHAFCLLALYFNCESIVFVLDVFRFQVARQRMQSRTQP